MRERGDTHVILAPVGFLADHVEILYDLDIEAQAWAKARGLTAVRTPSLNAGEGIVEAIARGGASPPRARTRMMPAPPHPSKHNMI